MIPLIHQQDQDPGIGEDDCVKIYNTGRREEKEREFSTKSVVVAH